MKWIISNHKDQLIDKDYINNINNLLKSTVNLIICPNDSQLNEFKEVNCLLGSQDLDYNFNLEDLKSIAVKYTILGHSDKRREYHETNQEINQKIKRLVTANICPIICIGEETENTIDIKKIIEIELKECLEKIKINEIIIAYEPIWAIGSGKIPNKELLEDILEFIKIKTKELIGIEPIVIYGGSVNENTIELLEQIKVLDGYLIGSASIDINKLKHLIEVIK